MYKEHIDIIKNKIHKLSVIDNNRTIFGSKNHDYKSIKVSSNEILNFELKYKISLPIDFRLFLENVGFGCGPDYGIYNFEKMTNQYEDWKSWFDNNSELSFDCELTNIVTQELIEKKINDIDNFHYKRLLRIDGILPFQTEGCTYYNCIIISGEQKGKIWSIDTNEFDIFPAGTTKEFTYLEWYENWLDNSIQKISDSNIANTPAISKTVEKSWLKRILKIN